MFSLGLGKEADTQTPLSSAELGHPPLTGRETMNESHQHDVKIKLTENGVKFRSPYDGSKHEFTPENVVDIQCNL